MGTRLRHASRALLAIAGGVAFFLAYRSHARGSGAADCPASESGVVVVETSTHTLSLCESGRRVDSFAVRIGHDGIGKTREGDGKTPLGTYRLGAARSSATYGTFVPVAYPTAEQRRAGFTGSAVGVHGPHRLVRWAGSVANLFDTTDGCIGLASDEDMDRFASWTRRQRPREIVLR